MKTLALFITFIIVFSSCSPLQEKLTMSETEIWRLTWKMIISVEEENYTLAEKQLDSLLLTGENIQPKYLHHGLKALEKLGKNEKLMEIAGRLDQSKLTDLCNRDLFTVILKNAKPCEGIEVYEARNKELQMELVWMYVNDQASRGNVMQDFIEKYNLNPDSIITDQAIDVDSIHRNRLKEIFEEHGFPTRELIGKDAMEAIFYIIQHADGDKEWQMSQLPNIEKAVKNGDLDGQLYAYLYDRIKINAGEKQLYGTQFVNVDPVNSTFALGETEDPENLDKRRMEIGLMPIDMYEELIRRNF